MLLLVGLGCSIAAYIYLGHPAAAILSSVAFGLGLCWNLNLGAIGMLMALVAGLIAIAVTSPEYDLTLNGMVFASLVCFLWVCWGFKITIFGPEGNPS